ncbi:MAG: zinc-dependent metalloprotease, partial [Chitinophagaceae bacterium]|nr:zinc-dependent metalloprotease [Chitinophagaceae bacterium]
PMDIRYNMINWVHRSTRGWSYGARISDPRTGEIIKGNVTLGSLRVRLDYLIAQGLLAPFEKGEKLLPAQDPMLQMALNRLRQLSAHEVGHTLGLMHNYASSTNNRASVMDYPHPLVRVKPDGSIDLADAYDLKIGAWDKVAINWGYRQYAPGTAESTALSKVLEDAANSGLHFISDRDARAPGGLHPLAHLWDNGSNPTEELKRVMALRGAALRQFGPANIPNGTPMALLEDVLVPVYLFHRYQAEAVVKLIGGTHYTYALRGDKQVVNRTLDKATQTRALEALLDCIAPANLLLPDSLLALIPPRPAGYDFTGELFSKKTGLLLDALSPAEAACDMVVALLMHPERLNRLAGNEPGGSTLALSEMLQTLFANTYYAPRISGKQGLIQQQNEQVILTYLLAATLNNDVNYAARAVVKNQLASLQARLTALSKKPDMAPFWKGHYLLALQRMEKPELAKPTLHAQVPPGAPIGCE